MLYYVVMKVHISRITKRYKDKTYVCPLLVHSYRDENGKPRNKTILNLSVLPEHALEALDAALRGGKSGEIYRKREFYSSFLLDLAPLPLQKEGGLGGMDFPDMSETPYMSETP